LECIDELVHDYVVCVNMNKACSKSVVA